MEKRSMAALGRLSVEDFKTTEKIPVQFLLDNIRSGLNIGSIFRTADAFALEGICLCGITAQPPHREILKTALGSTESVAWSYYESAALAISKLKEDGYEIWAIEQTSDAVWLHEMPIQVGHKYVFILGNEVEGVGEDLLPLCNGAIEIPQFGTKHSLNVAVAAGMVAWEATKQMRL